MSSPADNPARAAGESSRTFVIRADLAAADDPAFVLIDVADYHADVGVLVEIEIVSKERFDPGRIVDCRAGRQAQMSRTTRTGAIPPAGHLRSAGM
jgi:hypothetical protein